MRHCSRPAGSGDNIPLRRGGNDLWHVVVVPAARDKGCAQAVVTRRHVGWLMWGLAICRRNESDEVSYGGQTSYEARIGARRERENAREKWER